MSVGTNLRSAAMAGFLSGLCACAADGEDVPIAAVSTQGIIYGDDDRRELYEEAATSLREGARNAVVGLVPKGRLQRPATGEVRLSATQLGAAYGLCAGERFIDQPTLADCTGVLIDRDLVLTAGHCFEQAACDDYYYVFDYFYRAAGELETLGANDVYSCQRLVAQEISDRAGQQIDYAVIQLDRAVSDRTPLVVRDSMAIDNEPLVVIGTGSGLPVKIDRGGRVVGARASQHDYFSLEADTFEGSSGSAVLDAKGLLLGVLVRGGKDYVASGVQDCQTVHHLERALEGNLPDGDLAHEEATYASRALDGLCARGFPSAQLCGASTSCGDGFCTNDESRASCPEDCDPCDGTDCGARGSLPFAAGEDVKQSAGTGRGSGGGCSLAVAAQRPGQLPWLLGLLSAALLRSRAGTRTSTLGSRAGTRASTLRRRRAFSRPAP